MKQAISKNKKYFWYVLYGLLLTVGFLYYFFPSDAFKNYIQKTATRVNPRLILSVGSVQPYIPFGLKLNKTKLCLKTKPDAGIFMTDSLLIRPELWSILKGRPKYCFDCSAYDGNLKGIVYVKKKDINTFLTTSIELREIHIDNDANFSSLIGGNLKGVLGGILVFAGKYSHMMEGVGEADIKIADGRFEFLHPILSLKSVAFSGLTIKMSLKNQKINLNHVELEGREIRGTLLGSVSLRQELKKSSLDLKGTIELLAGFARGGEDTRKSLNFIKQRLKNGKLSFVIHGTIKEPKLKFI